ncbi:MAG: biopolymer transporter ExbD [Leptospiraceae bacterium]|nr:biopolymer transporter ExbD [Leptospiraceae bacterium]MDW7975991.1 biopolymer transporter ExbD [Leptospiraceae bacterium]
MNKFEYKKKSFNIDITPLVDVIFLVIIFLILNVGKIHSFLNIQLPKSEVNLIEVKGKIPTISIVYEKNHYEIYWNQQIISLNQISEFLIQSHTEKIILKADKDVPYGIVVRVLSEIKKSKSVELLLEYEVE